MTAADGGLERFASVFRDEIARKVEYSFTGHPSALGVMVLGTGLAFLRRADQVAPRFAERERWSVIGAELVARLAPDAIGFRADYWGARIERATMYLRLNPGLPETHLRQALSGAAAGVWVGPSPHDLARIFGIHYPSIISVRLARAEPTRMSVYFSLPAGRPSLVSYMAELVDALELPASLCTEIPSVMSAMQLRVEPSVVGIDIAATPDGRAIKVDYPEPPVGSVLTALQRCGAAPVATKHLGRVAVALRRTTFTYFGGKFGARGLAGWKAYVQVWATSPSLADATAPRLRLWDDPSGAFVPVFN